MGTNKGHMERKKERKKGKVDKGRAAWLRTCFTLHKITHAHHSEPTLCFEHHAKTETLLG
jgi:hypothetical protein